MKKAVVSHKLNNSTQVKHQHDKLPNGEHLPLLAGNFNDMALRSKSVIQSLYQDKKTLQKMRQRHKAKKIYFDKIFTPNRVFASESYETDNQNTQMPRNMQKHILDEINDFTKFATGRKNKRL